MSELKSSGQLQFKHVFSRPPGANARSVAPVLRNAAAASQSDSDSESRSLADSDSDSDPGSKLGIKELLARMPVFHDQGVGSPSDTDDESRSSERERSAYSEGLHNRELNNGRTSEVSRIMI